VDRASPGSTGSRRGHVGKIVQRLNVAQVDGDPELALHARSLTVGAPRVEMAEPEASRGAPEAMGNRWGNTPASEAGPATPDWLT